LIIPVVVLFSYKIGMLSQELVLRKQHQLILDSTGEGILGVDLNGNHTFVNPAAASMLGYTVDDLLGRHSHAVWHHTKIDGSVYPEKDCPIYSAITDGAVHHNVSNEVFWKKDKTSFPVEYTSTPVVNEAGTITGAVLIFNDISERQTAEESLSRLAAIITSSDDSIYGGTLDGRITHWNAAAEKMYGYSAAEAIGCPLSMLLPDGGLDDISDKIGRIVSGETSVRYETVRKRRDGTLLDVSVRTSAILDSNGKVVGIAGIARDIGDRKKADAERESLILQLQESLANVKRLSGLLPICASCKKIRDDGGYWSEVETYISQNSDADFSHGICPDCARKLYPDYFKKKKA